MTRYLSQRRKNKRWPDNDENTRRWRHWTSTDLTCTSSFFAMNISFLWIVMNLTTLATVSLHTSSGHVKLHVRIRITNLMVTNQMAYSLGFKVEIVVEMDFALKTNILPLRKNNISPWEPSVRTLHTYWSMKQSNLNGRIIKNFNCHCHVRFANSGINLLQTVFFYKLHLEENKMCDG